MRISMHDIKKVYPFSSNGINAIVLCNSENKKVYISDHIENRDALFDLIASYLPQDETPDDA